VPSAGILQPVGLSSDPSTLVAAARTGDRRALARLITIVEDDRSGALEVLRLADRSSGRAARMGITGAPGAGKSTITDGLITVIRSGGSEVAVLAVDPTSPFSGGAVLGDRVRMQDHVSDSGVFIRSMASRGHLGGLSAAAPKALTVLDAAGFPEIIVETVGVGQDEVEIAEAADTTVVVLNPGWGDGIQAAKAGILEIGDLFVVNKADRPGVRDTVADLKAMLALDETSRWTPPVLTAVAATGEGIEELWAEVRRHRAFLAEEGLIESRRRARRRGELETALVAAFRRRARGALSGDAGAGVLALVEAGDLDPWSAAESMLAGGDGAVPAE
jgi:LAO/AO transport system kinase